MKKERGANGLLSLDEIGERLERVLAESPADETEIVWLETRHGSARRQGSRVDVHAGPHRNVLVRVLDRGRVGSFRTGAGELGDLADAVRQAMAQSRVRDPLAGLPHLPADSAPLEGPTELFDPAIARLGKRRVRSYLGDLKTRRATVRLRWAEGRVAVFNSRDVRRMARVTAAECEARTGRGPGAGRAVDASRRLDDLAPAALLDRARHRSGSPDGAEPATGAGPVVLAPEAVIDLCRLLNETSFSAKAYYDGTSFLREHVNVQVFDRRFNLVDDATAADGLAFPFDLEGTAKRRVDLILKGAPKTPTLDQRQAAVLGLPPTAHAIGGNDARAENLFLVAGEEAENDLVAAVGDGVWIGWLDHLECTEPRRVRFRCRARGVRRIENGRLGIALEDFHWSDTLLRAFSSLVGIGTDPTRRLSPDGYLGAMTAPAVALAGVELGEAMTAPPTAAAE